MKILFSYTSQAVFRVAKNIILTQCAHIDMFNSVQLLCTSDSHFCPNQGISHMAVWPYFGWVEMHKI